MYGSFIRRYRKHLRKGFIVNGVPARTNPNKSRPQKHRSKNGTHSSSLTALLPDAVISPRKMTWCGLKCIAKCQLFLRCRSNNKLSKAARNEEVHDGAMAGFLIWVSEMTNICEKCLPYRERLGLDLANPGYQSKTRQRTDAFRRFSGHLQSLRLR